MKKVPAIGLLVLSILLLANFNFDAYGYDFFGNDIGTALVQDADACAAACKGNTQCRGWTWVKAQGKCYLKNPVAAPAFSPACPTNSECVSGRKRSDGWCGEDPSRNVPGSLTVAGQPIVTGQGQVLFLPPARGLSCKPRVSTTCTGWWIFKSCSKTQTIDYFWLP
jgi:hypothetical protein